MSIQNQNPPNTTQPTSDETPSPLPAHLHPLLHALRTRRSTLTLHPSLPAPLTPSTLTALLLETIKHTPSPFNLQSTRAVLLLGPHSQTFWDICAAALRPALDPTTFALINSRIDEFKTGYGTCLWYEDPGAMRRMREGMGEGRWGLVGGKMPEWTQHSQGMHHHVFWTLLCSAAGEAAERIGANLQHYGMGPGGELDRRVAEEWDVPAEWELRAQSVFGTAAGPPRGEPKEFEEVEGRRMFVYGG